MDKKIIFLSEMGFQGPIPRAHDNMRVEFAQFCALKAVHWPMTQMDQIQDKFDYAILLVGKTDKFREQIYDIDVVQEAKKFADKVYFMQEGPSWIYEDMPVAQQFWHYNLLADVDGILTENKTDIPYFEGLIGNKPIHDIPSLMITDYIEDAKKIEKQDKTIIGGNFCHWYGGFTSYIIANEFENPIYVPSMGRRKPHEEAAPNLNHLPYMTWKEWIYKLAEFKYAVHLMPTIAAGTFAMNCAYLGTPCIGYKEADTQRQLFPDLSVEIGDLKGARELANRLKNDSKFYEEQAVNGKVNYEKYHSEESFLKHMENIL